MQGHAVSAVILAAGLSTRMGGAAKALRQLAGQSFLERVAEAFRLGGVDDIIVVTGHQAEACAGAARALDTRTAENPHYALGMFSSIQCGLAAALEHFPHSRAVMLSPVDAALVMPRSVRAMLAAFEERSRGPEPRRIMAAAINGRQGHPALIPAAHIPAILARPASGESPGSPPGLRGYYQLLESQGQAVIQVPLPDAGVLSDLDTAGDSAAAGAWLAATRGRSLPSPAEAWQLLCLADLSAKKMRHSLLVARGSLRLGLRLAGRGLLPENSLLLLTGAGLLHDLTRQDREHAMSAARLLRGLGWPHSAFVVGCHTRLPEAYLARMGIHGPDKKFQCPDIPPEAAADPALDRELFHAAVAVYMADKYARRDHLSDISARFKDIRDWFRNDAAALEGIDEREKTVRAVESWLQELLGCELLQVVGAPSGHALEAELDALAGDAFQ